MPAPPGTPGGSHASAPAGSDGGGGGATTVPMPMVGGAAACGPTGRPNNAVNDADADTGGAPAGTANRVPHRGHTTSRLPRSAAVGPRQPPHENITCDDCRAMAAWLGPHSGGGSGDGVEDGLARRRLRERRLEQRDLG